MEMRRYFAKCNYCWESKDQTSFSDYKEDFPSSIAAVAGATEARIILCIVRLIRHNYLSVFIKFLIYLVGFSTFRAVHTISTSAAAALLLSSTLHFEIYNSLNVRTASETEMLICCLFLSRQLNAAASGAFSL